MHIILSLTSSSERHSELTRVFKNCDACVSIRDRGIGEALHSVGQDTYCVGA